jgi:hypothetical protein
VLRTIVGLGIVCAAGAACSARAQALTPAATPLNAPQPPPRVVVPAPERPTLPEEPAAPAAASTPSGTSGAAGRGRDSAPPPTRPAPPPAAEPPATSAPPPPLLTSANTAEFERRVRATLQKAQGDLSQVKRDSLGTEARAQFDSALGFIRQTEEALKVKNLVYAGQLADKAATMAALLKR